MKATSVDTPVGKIFVPLGPEQCAALPINTAAEYLGVGRTTIYDLLKKGFIRSIRIGIQTVRFALRDDRARPARWKKSGQLTNQIGMIQ